MVRANQSSPAEPGSRASSDSLTIGECDSAVRRSAHDIVAAPPQTSGGWFVVSVTPGRSRHRICSPRHFLPGAPTSRYPQDSHAADVTAKRTCGKPDNDGRLKHLASRARPMRVMNRAAGQSSDNSGGLEAMLKLATLADNWRQVIHRCAWCKRMFDERSGACTTFVAFGASTVTTDGMCAACGRRALAQIAGRRGRLAA